MEKSLKKSYMFENIYNSVKDRHQWLPPLQKKGDISWSNKGEQTNNTSKNRLILFLSNDIKHMAEFLISK